MGAMGAIAPTAKKLWGRRPQVAPTGIVLSQVFETVQEAQLPQRNSASVAQLTRCFSAVAV